jgi:hypothetical protein
VNPVRAFVIVAVAGLLADCSASSTVDDPIVSVVERLRKIVWYDLKTWQVHDETAPRTAPASTTPASPRTAAPLSSPASSPAAPPLSTYPPTTCCA